MSKKEIVFISMGLIISAILFGVMLGVAISKISPDVEEETTTEIIMEDVKNG